MSYRSNAFIWVCVFVFCLSVTAAAQVSPNGAKPQVLVLGTFHFDNPGLDRAKIKVDDVFSDQRQKEISEINALLKKFKPTKIAIEREFGSTKITEQYAQFLAGKYELTRNEIDQIGFRLAKESGHSQIYPIDAKGNFDLEKVIAFAAANGQKSEVDKLFAYIREIEQAYAENLRTKTFRQILKAENAPEKLRRDHAFYLSIARIGKDSNYAGTDLLRDWYERNLKIFTNLVRITDNPQDRILVLIGAGHAPLLREFLSDSNEYEVVEAGNYL